MAQRYGAGLESLFPSGFPGSTPGPGVTLSTCSEHYQLAQLKMKKKVKKTNKILILAICLIITYLVAFIGSLFTSQGVKSSWYQSIKPSITPPNWIFPIAWGILFFLMALSLYFAWINAKNNDKRNIAIIFGINFVLNILWSFLYFYMKNPSMAFIDIILVWFSILSMILATWKINRTASLILIPYLLWVSFASILNYLSI